MMSAYDDSDVVQVEKEVKAVLKDIKDINPKAKTHILIIPKKPLLDISDFLQNADSLYQTNFWKSVDEIIDILGLRDKGFQIKIHKGKDGGQEVFHFHLHLLANV